MQLELLLIDNSFGIHRGHPSRQFEGLIHQFGSFV